MSFTKYEGRITGEVRHGSIIAGLDGGNLQIAKSHTPSEAITIERGDIADMLQALSDLIARGAFDVPQIDRADFLAAPLLMYGRKDLRVQLIDNTGPIAQIQIRAGMDVVDLIKVEVFGRQKANAYSSSFDGIDRGVLGRIEARPWSTVEDIAAWVAGDGSDAQRNALADGIRLGWPAAPFAPSKEEDGDGFLIGMAVVSDTGAPLSESEACEAFEVSDDHSQ